MWFVRFKQIVCFLLMPWLLSILIQLLGRVFLSAQFAANDIATLSGNEIFSIFLVSLKYDIRTASMGFGVILLLSCMVIFSQYLYQCWQKFLLIISIFFSSIFVIFTITNVEYVITFNKPIDIFIFGLIDDDTKAILDTIWQDYPVVSIALLFIFTLIFFIHFYRYWQVFVINKIYKINRNRSAIPATFLILLVIFIGCRGSLGTFPLKRADSQLSDNKNINALVPNGIFAFHWAYSDYLKENQFTEIPYEVSQKLLKNFFGEDKPNKPAIFFATTKTNEIAKNNPPNVILSVMESMGTYLFRFDNQERDLLGSLRQHLKQDWLFSRFVSEGDGTIASLNRLFVRSPISQISQSSAQSINFTSNMFKPFLDNGYKVIFITGGNGAWQNLTQFLLNLGVSEFVEENTLKKLYPDAPKFAWGVPDEYMFNYAKLRLKEAEKNGEHVMIMTMSITNHPPYAIPKSYEYHNYQISDAEKERLKNFGSENRITDMFNTFYYSNDQLGKFISWIKSTSLRDNTIMAFTGDHTLRGIGFPDLKESALGHAVPFYLYVPPKYQKGAFYDSNKVGSHKDIFPTLYHLALSDTKFYRTGCNLLDQNLDTNWCNIGYNPNVFITSEGAYDVSSRKFMLWSSKDATNLLLSEPMILSNDKDNDNVKKIMQWSNFEELLHWQIIEQINQAKNKQTRK